MIYSIREVISAKISGEWGKEGTEEDGVKVIRTSNFVNDGTIDYTDVVFRDIVENKVERKKLYYGDIIIEKSGGSPNQPVGRVVFFDLKTYEPYLCNNFTTILRPNKNLIYPEYLFYHLFYLYQNGKTKKYQNKTTGIINLKLDDYLEEKLFVPEFEKQIQICSGLNRIRGVVQKRQNTIKQLDDFVNSTFVERFGDPVVGRKYPYVTFKEVSKVRQGLQIPISERKTQGGKKRFPYITNQYLNGGKIAEYIENPSFNVICHKDDVLMTRTGNTGIVVTDVEGVFHNNFFLVDYDRTLVNRDYLVTYLQFPMIKQMLIKKASTTTIPDLNHGDFYSTKFPLPPLSLQNRFAEIVRKTQAIKQRFQESLEELNNLYQSLSQRAFQGKLDLSRLDVQEEVEKFQRRPDVSAKESIENILLRDNSAFYDTSHVRKREERIEPVLSEAMKVREPEMKYGRFNIEQVAERIKARYSGYHFSFEMLYRFLQKTLAEVPYYSSEELKKQPELNSEQDIRWFIQAAIVNIERGENEKRLLNPFIQLKQHFYNAEEENMSLHVIKEDYELLRERNKKERSGIYFSIVEL